MEKTRAEQVAGIRHGHYAKKQIFCDARLISWSHRRRFEIGLELASEFEGARILDYGCGDGTFLAMLMSGTHAPSEAIGSELYRHTVEDCEARLGNSKLRFILIDDLKGIPPFDGLFCMEVLEHVVELPAILDRLESLLAPKGKLIVSVPVETGLPLICKQIARRIAGWRGVGDYPGHHPYSVPEYISAIFASGRRQIVRPIARDEHGATFPDHKGFNWMRFRQMLAERFEIEKIVGSPIRWLPVHLSSQAWFILRKKANGAQS